MPSARSLRRNSSPGTPTKKCRQNYSPDKNLLAPSGSKTPPPPSHPTPIQTDKSLPPCKWPAPAPSTHFPSPAPTRSPARRSTPSISAPLPFHRGQTQSDLPSHQKKQAPDSHSKHPPA